MLMQFRRSLRLMVIEAIVLFPKTKRTHRFLIFNPKSTFHFVNKPTRNILILGVFLLIITGCSTIHSENVSQFRQGVAQTHQQLDAAFHDANALAREEEINYLLATTRPGITEADVTPALNTDDVAAWDDAFSKIESYASALEMLLSSDQSKQFSDAILALSTDLNSSKTRININPGVAAAFTELGTVLIDLKTQTSAKAAMQMADPAIRNTLTQMARAIGNSDQSPGVRSVVWANWETKLAEGPIRAYADAQIGNHPEQKKVAAQSYVTMLDQRDAQLQILASLRQSLLLLADVHTAAASGSTANVASLISAISKRVDETQSLLISLKTK
ncbi:MAG TPA: hypothetical protein VFE58_05785 [Tepidisphaeraceae bacterium]|jgi:hypothetical protein|nr:hypothetical protein [Tepidisphaeraceae bacterium]